MKFLSGFRHSLPLVTAAAFVFVVAGGAKSQVRVSPAPEPKPKFKIVRPQARFDRKAAEQALEKGAATIKGAVCVYRKTGKGLFGPTAKFTSDQIRVSLFPITPYFEEFQRLRERDEKGTVVFMSEEAYGIRIDAATDKNGNFVFINIKPGKYFLHAIFAFDQIKTRQVYVGSGTDGVSTVDFYAAENYRVDATSRLERPIEVRKDGETVRTDLKKGWGGILNKGC